MLGRGERRLTRGQSTQENLAEAGSQRGLVSVTRMASEPTLTGLVEVSLINYMNYDLVTTQLQHNDFHVM